MSARGRLGSRRPRLASASGTSGPWPSVALAAGLALGVAVPLPGCAQESPAGGLPAARDALRRGEHEEAVRAYRALAEADGDPEAARGWAGALAATGAYEEALDALDRSEAAGAPPVELDRMRGALLRRIGRTAEAEAALRSAIEGGASDAPLARLELGRIEWNTGRRDDALERFDGFIDLYNGGSARTAAELAAVGHALGYLGARDPALFHDAVRAFEEAIEADPDGADARVGLAGLFLDKYDSRAAGELLDEALARSPAHAGALLAKARRAKFDGSSEALEFAERSLEVNPADPAARAFLARLYLDLEDVERAEREARRALETDPASLEAWTELAAAAHLREDSSAFGEARDRVLSVDPSHAELYEALAEVSYRTHRYAEAVGFARRAIALDSTAWSAHAALGLNQLRVGELEAGRETLERAFAGDPFNVWVKNTLDLLDELARFEETASRRFVFRFHPDEAELLGIYAPVLAEEAFDALSARYGARPPTPISVEVYDRHADFSVRTVGLAGIGALGVSFGSVLAMDSPGARPPGEFNWGSTLWHEISHAFTLGHTGHRVPRWLSEGLAVLDERHARDGWGSDVTPDFLLAFREERLPSLERFNYGFVRPAYPGQVQHSYFMASLLCEMIEEEHGVEAILAMLAGYRDGLETAEVFRRVFDADLADFDRRLRDFIGLRYQTALASLGTPAADGAPEPLGRFATALGTGARLYDEGRIDEAIAALEAARRMFPEYAGPDSPILLLARIHAERDDWPAAAEAYRAFVDRNESHYEARLGLALAEESLGNAAAAREALAEAVWIDPFEPDLHARLAVAYEEAGEWEAAIRERRAILALEPADRAEAYYRLAYAHHRGGDAEAARHALLRALEIAPNYEAALDLLLEIRGGA